MDPPLTSLTALKRYERTAEGRHQAVEVRCYFMTINRDYDDRRVSVISKEQETRRRLSNTDDQMSNG